MKCAQHAAHNPKFEKMGLLRHLNGGHKKIKGPTHMNVSTTLLPQPLPTFSFRAVHLNVSFLNIGLF